jgi:hypothetical protein
VPYAPRPASASAAVALALALVAPAAARAAFTPEQQACVNAFNKQFAKTVKAFGKDYAKCAKDRAKSTDDNDKLEGLTVPACFAADRKGKQLAANTKAAEEFAAACAGGNNPGVAVTSPTTAGAAATQKEQGVFTVLYGADVDTAVVREVDAVAASKCQQSVTKVVLKCQDTRLNEFVKCKKNEMKNRNATTAEQISTCMNTAWVVDERQKVAKKCHLDAGGDVDGIRKEIQEDCVAMAVDLSDAFPGCATDDATALHACLDERVACATCRALRDVDALAGSSLDCDVIDNGAPDDSCSPLATDTVDIPSTAEPPNTPGTAGVVVTNPNLITQFGGAGFDLNNARYTRWRARGPAQTPDAILVVVAGFGGDANNFKILAENLIPRVLADHGLVLEVWGFQRRSNQLEDRAGVLIAQSLADPLVALDWYYGAELTLALHPALVAGPNRRAFFYNSSSDVPFLANWTSQVHGLDIDAVIQAAHAAVANDNVFLGGHSAGTGFVARYASTDFDLTGGGPADPGYAKIRGLVLWEGGGGTTATPPLSADSLDRIEAKFDGGLFGAVRDNAARCVDGVTPCTIATEAAACVGQTPPKCTLPEPAYAALPGLSPRVTASSEPGAVQGATDPDTGKVILQVDQGSPGNNAIAKVPDLALLGLILPPSTVEGAFGGFLDDDGIAAGFSPAISTSIGAPGSLMLGLQTWRDVIQGGFPASVLPNNGPPPTTLPGTRWGQEKEVVRVDRFRTTFLSGGSNAADWYYGTSGLNVTSAPGVCAVGTCDTVGSLTCTAGPLVGNACATNEQCGQCTAGNVGAFCDAASDCAQAISLDSTALSVGRGRRDIVNLTQAPNVDIPVICFGGTNGLTPVPGLYTAFGQSIGLCTAPSCDGTPRVVDAALPNPAFPTFGGVNGGFEVHMSEGFAHNDVTTAEDGPDNHVIGPLGDFIARNVQ